ncbi:MAG: hypothetical protein CMA72_04605 [Euryarchaeota archaeon]|nr:hypothetical protein [Euryarchaeota archaeon]
MDSTSRIDFPPTALGAGLPIPILVTIAFRFLPMLGNAPFMPHAGSFGQVSLQRGIRLDRTFDLVQSVKHPFDLGSRNILNGPLEQNDRPPPKQKSEGYQKGNGGKFHERIHQMKSFRQRQALEKQIPECPIFYFSEGK